MGDEATTMSLAPGVSSVVRIYELRDGYAKGGEEGGEVESGADVDACELADSCRARTTFVH